MRISQRSNLNKSQAELDFVDIDTQEDLQLFLDPFFLSRRTDKWSIDATLTIRSFFQRTIDLIRANNMDEASRLFDFLHEPNVTCLGMSRGNPRGRGVGPEDSNKIFERLIESRAIQTGLIQDIEDSILFIDHFGKDKLSDMTTNIIRKHLIEYTQSQCELHGIELTDNVVSGFYWDRNLNDWTSEHTRMLVIDDGPIILVPKGVVSYCKQYTPERYYRHFVLNYLQNEHLRLNTALVQRRVNGARYVTKKSLEEANPQSKEFLRRFTTEHPEILQQFKTETDERSLSNMEIADIQVRIVIDNLKAQLAAVATGRDTASDYHNLIIGVLDLIFYPHLIHPVKEREIHDGRKRIDLVFDNAAKTGIFSRLSNNMNIPSSYIFIECKNYSSDPNNPELDQLAGRFSVNRGKFGFILCRQIDNLNLFIQRCRDTFADGRGLIVPLVDNDIVQLLDNYSNWNSDYLETFLSNRIREIAIN